MGRMGLEWTLITTPIKLKEISAAPTGTAIIANTVQVYAKDKAGTSALYLKDDAGSEREIGQAGLVTGTGANGRVAFWTGTSTISSNAAFFWDNSNLRLGINTSSAPLFGMEVRANDSTAGANVIKAAGSSAGSYNLSRARGSVGSETAAQSTDSLGNLGFGGFDGSSYQFNSVMLQGVADENFTGSARGSYLSIFTTPAGSTTRAERMRVDKNGLIIIGGGATQLGLTGPGIETHVAVGLTGGSGVFSVGFGAAAFGNFQGRSARGTSGSPTATQLDDVIARFSSIGFGTTVYAPSFRAAMDHLAAENWTDTAQGTYIKLHTTPTGSTTSAERFRIGPAGQWGIGGATFGTANNIFKSGGAAAAPSWGTINLLDSNSIGDTLTGTVVRGDLIVGNSTPKWSRFAVGAASTLLKSNGTDPSWLDYTTDWLSQYALLAGRSGGQTLKGGTDASDALTLQSTNNATKGKIKLGTASAYDEANDCLLLGTTTYTTTGKKLTIEGTVTENTTSHAGARFANTFTGSAGGAGNEMFQIQANCTFQPSASIAETNGFRVDALADPGAGVTVTNHRGGRFVTYSGSGAGAITNMFGLQLVPIFGSVKPTNSSGLFVSNVGSASVTNAIGIKIEKPTGATNNYYMEFDTADATDPTGGGGAANGRIPILVGGTLRYLAYY